ncbi:50S ribosomal protein L30e [Candidatus Woesearchaeota archaeon]|nr:50S ribosomal protein L30e [Candidatus Woesearchaeota archaeon]MBT4631079.1 50S ribosomal protein L30e [Candidatus Woesearchaeota archaeon]
MDNLKKALKDNKLIVGSDETLKLLKKGKTKEAFVSSNCQAESLNSLEKYCEINKCKLDKLKENSKELGAICKKPFSINMCCIIK